MTERNTSGLAARGRRTIGASCFVALVLFSLIAPSVSALVTLTAASGATQIVSDTQCGAAVAWPLGGTIDITNGEDVYIPMEAHWNDHRTPLNKWGFQNTFTIQAFYRTTNYFRGYTVTTYGDTYDWDVFGETVPNVQEYTSMAILYSAYVYRNGDPIGTFLCYAEGTSYYYFD